MKPFHVALAFVFGVLALVSVFIFATFSGGTGPRVGNVSIWGPLPAEVVDEVLKSITTNSDGYEGLEYREFSEASFIPALTEAIAAGRGPDLIIFPSDRVVSDGDKVAAIPYRSIPRRDFQDAYIQAGEIFLTAEGIVALPFFIDPYVMYWNRALFSQAGVARPPRYWDEYRAIAPSLSKKTQSGTLVQSAVALGQWDNVVHAKEIFTALLYGLGNNIISINAKGDLEPRLSDTVEGGVNTAELALRFYAEFADPVQPVYSWNRSLTDSRSAFLAGELAIYLGKASEARTLRSANPNLNYDVAAFPQVREGRVGTPALLYGLAIPRGARNVQGALQSAVLLSGTEVQTTLANIVGLPSVRRDILSLPPEDPYATVFRDAALNAFSFYDPEPQASAAIFKRMVENVSSGRLRISEAVRSGQSELSSLIKVE